MGYRLAGLVGVEDLPKSPIMYIMSTKSDVGWLMPAAVGHPLFPPLTSDVAPEGCLAASPGSL